MTKKNGANKPNGKGDSPRNNNSKEFRDNYLKIKWGKSNKKLDKKGNK